MIQFTARCASEDAVFVNGVILPVGLPLGMGAGQGGYSTETALPLDMSFCA
jgi:hypothetical protein